MERKAIILSMQILFIFLIVLTGLTANDMYLVYNMENVYGNYPDFLKEDLFGSWFDWFSEYF